MKRYILALTLLLVSGSIFAFCVAGATVANAAIPCFSGLSATPANVTPTMWLQGKADFAVNGSIAVAPGVCTAGGTTGGCDSDGMAPMDTLCLFDSNEILGDGAACMGSGAGTYYVLTDWGMSGFDGCPSAAATERCVLFAIDTTGAYGLQSRAQVNGWSAWDSIGTTACAVPNFSLGTIAEVDATHINLAFAPGDYALYGAYEAGDAPSSPIATNFTIYFMETAGLNAPPSYTVGAWTAGNTYAITGASTAVNNMVIPTLADPVNHRLYMTARINYEGRTTGLLSNQPIQLLAGSGDPSGAPVISGMNAVSNGLTTTVSWTSSDESRVTGYQIYWAPAGSDFTAVGSKISPVGSDNTYTAEVRIPSTTGFSVKVGAYLTDGSVQYSQPSMVKAANVVKSKVAKTIN